MRESEVRAALEKHKLSWEKFVEWMYGQTTGAYPDGTFDYYEWDVNRYIDLVVRGQPTFWD